MTSEKVEWIKLMRPLVDGHATQTMVSAFDRLTSRIYAAGIISFDEFLGTQTVIVTARRVADSFSRTGLSGYFLPCSEAA